MSKPSTVLIVDDDKAVIEQLVQHFRRRNYEPIATADPTVVEQTLNTFQVELILLDLRMEGMDGFDVLKMLRERKVSIPVLIITAYFQDEQKRLKEMGIAREDVIEKPLRDFSKVEAQINRKLNQTLLPEQVFSDYEDEIYYENRTKVVVVDDEPDMNEMLKEVLEARRYQVAMFKRGDEALEYLLNHECHIAIVDMKIPGLTGDRLIQQALAKKPTLKVIPISASYREDIEDQLKRAGVDPKKLLTKPFNIPTLVEQVKVLASEAGTLGVWGQKGIAG